MTVVEPKVVHTFLRQGPASAAVHFSIASSALTIPVATLFCTPPAPAPVSYAATAHVKPTLPSALDCHKSEATHVRILAVGNTTAVKSWECHRTKR